MFYSKDKQPRKRLDPKTAKLKAADFCAYQERSQQEVRDKLYTYGLHEEEVEEAIAELIIDGFISEERFAKTYAGGKFRVKGWGKRKIIQGLKQHKISEYCIKIAMQEINPEDYYSTLVKHAEKKLPTIKSTSDYIRKGKLTQHLIAKGFEMDLISEVVSDIVNNKMNDPS